MTARIPHRHLWSLDGLSGAELLSLIETAHDLKHGDAATRPLRGRNIALLSNAPGNAYVAAFERAAEQLGAKVTVLGSRSVDGTGRLLGRLYDAIDCTGLDDRTAEQVDREAGVPVYNGLADGNHPMQTLATLVGLRERCGKSLPLLRVAYVGDARTAAGRRLQQAADLIGMALRVVPGPPGPQGRLEDVDAVLTARDVEPAATPSADHSYVLQAMLVSSMT